MRQYQGGVMAERTPRCAGSTLRARPRETDHAWRQEGECESHCECNGTGSKAGLLENFVKSLRELQVGKKQGGNMSGTYTNLQAVRNGSHWRRSVSHFDEILIMWGFLLLLF